jgi:hypothetical protein
MLTIAITFAIFLSIQLEARNVKEVRQRYLEYRSRFGKRNEPREIQNAR